MLSIAYTRYLDNIHVEVRVYAKSNKNAKKCSRRWGRIWISKEVYSIEHQVPATLECLL